GRSHDRDRQRARRPPGLHRTDCRGPLRAAAPAAVGAVGGSLPAAGRERRPGRLLGATREVRHHPDRDRRVGGGRLRVPHRHPRAREPASPRPGRAGCRDRPRAAPPAAGGHDARLPRAHAVLQLEPGDDRPRRHRHPHRRRAVQPPGRAAVPDPDLHGRDVPAARRGRHGRGHGGELFPLRGTARGDDVRAVLPDRSDGADDDLRDGVGERVGDARPPGHPDPHTGDARLHRSAHRDPEPPGLPRTCRRGRGRRRLGSPVGRVPGRPRRLQGRERRRRARRRGRHAPGRGLRPRGSGARDRHRRPARRRRVRRPGRHVHGPLGGGAGRAAPAGGRDGGPGPGGHRERRGGRDRGRRRPRGPHAPSGRRDVPVQDGRRGPRHLPGVL
ncbi:MAG: diguanylate cyclase/phosphodiesterase (GGDEF & EAL domains) with PAS/PAC sensor(s), partial [uncultured Blastococcus sp.]